MVVVILGYVYTHRYGNHMIALQDSQLTVRNHFILALTPFSRQHIFNGIAKGVA